MCSWELIFCDFPPPPPNLTILPTYGCYSFSSWQCARDPLLRRVNSTNPDGLNEICSTEDAFYLRLHCMWKPTAAVNEEEGWVFCFPEPILYSCHPTLFFCDIIWAMFSSSCLLRSSPLLSRHAFQILLFSASFQKAFARTCSSLALEKIQLLEELELNCPCSSFLFEKVLLPLLLLILGGCFS